MINLFFSKYIYRLYSASLLTVVFLYHHQESLPVLPLDMFGGYFILLLLSIFLILILSINDALEELLLSFSSIAYSKNFKENFKLSVYDRLLFATSVSMFLVLIGMLIGVYFDGSPFDPDSRCLGMGGLDC